VDLEPASHRLSKITVEKTATEAGINSPQQSAVVQTRRLEVVAAGPEVLAVGLETGEQRE
jgi:hypothetical protein